MWLALYEGLEPLDFATLYGLDAAWEEEGNRNGRCLMVFYHDTSRTPETFYEGSYFYFMFSTHPHAQPLVVMFDRPVRWSSKVQGDVYGVPCTVHLRRCEACLFPGITVRSPPPRPRILMGCVLRRCALCQREGRAFPPWYCGEECQRAHWFAGGHRLQHY